MTAKGRRQGPAKRTTNHSVLIVTNGRITERSYLQEVKRRFAGTDLKIEVEFKAGEPYTVVRKYCSPAGDPTGYNEVWFVFDEDGKDISQAMAAIQRQDNKRTRWGCVVTRPCFEVWLAAHYEQVGNCVTQREAQRKYEQLSGIPKGSKSLPDDFPFADMEKAASRCHLPQGSTGGPHELPSLPGSSMPHLLKALSTVAGRS